MNDRYDHELLLDYIEGELPAEKAARVDAMIASDDRLRQLVRGMQADRKALRAIAQEEPARSLVDDVLQGMERQMLLGDIAAEAQAPAAYQAQRRRMRLGARLVRFGMYSGLAAAILVAGGVMVVMLSDFPLLDQLDQWNNGASVASRQPADHAALEKDRLALADESAKTAPKPLAGASEFAGKGDGARSAAMSKSAQPALAEASPPAAAAEPAPTTSPEPVLASKTGPVAPAVTPTPEPTAVRLPAADPALISGANRFVAADAQPAPGNARIEVQSDNPELTREALLAWAVDNRVQVVTPGRSSSSLAYEPKKLAAKSGDSYTRGSIDKAGPSSRPAAVVAGEAAPGELRDEPAAEQEQAAPAGADTYAVVLNDEQVPQLLSYMNSYRAGQQRARLVEPTTDEERRELNEELTRVQRQVTQQVAVAQPQTPAEPQPAQLADTRQRREAEAFQGKAEAGSVAAEDRAVGGELKQSVTTWPKTRMGLEAAQEDAAAPAAQAVAQSPPETAPQGQAADADADSLAAFAWGAVLSNQLPLAPSTPLAMLQKRQVILPVVITEIIEPGADEPVEAEPALPPADTAPTE